MLNILSAVGNIMLKFQKDTLSICTATLNLRLRGTTVEQKILGMWKY